MATYISLEVPFILIEIKSNFDNQDAVVGPANWSLQVPPPAEIIIEVSPAGHIVFG
jgi:hypothetical protein